MKREHFRGPSSPASLRGTLWTLRRRFVLPDGRTVQGPPAAAACVLGRDESVEGTVLAAPVEPGTAFATPEDWACDRESPLGYPFHVVLPAAAEIPFAALERCHGRISLPRGSPGGGRKAPRPPGPGSVRAAEWKAEWRPLRGAARKLRQWAEDGRIVRVDLFGRRPAGAGRAAAVASPLSSFPLAAASGVPWNEPPLLWRHDLADGRGTAAVVVENAQRILEVDTRPGFSLKRVLLDGRKLDIHQRDPFRFILGPGPLPPCWVALDTDDGLWFFRVEG